MLLVGHTNCGGVAACLDLARSQADISPPGSVAPQRAIDRWLAPLTDLARSVLASANTQPATESHIDIRKHEEELAERLVDANVRAQVRNVCAAEPVLRAWTTQKQPLWVHGLVYDVGSGKLRDLNITRGCLRS